MSGWAPNGGMGVSVICIRQFLKGQGQAIFCHGAKPQAHNPFSTKLDINEHFASGVMLQQSGHHYGCHHDLIWVYGLFG